MAGMKMFKTFAKAVIDCFQTCLADYVPRIALFCESLDTRIVAQGAVDFVDEGVADVLSKETDGRHVHETPHTIQI